MTKLDQHIRNTVLLSMLVVVALIMTVDLVFTVSEELSNIDGDYSVLDALAFVLLTTPTSI